ncbi:decarboxylase [Salmonella enterica subsp. enterica]|nr:decarboxylase [Salmonella enterica subsp. enterica]
MLPADVAKKTAIPPTEALALPVHEAQSGVETAFRYHARQCLMNSRRIALLADFLAGRFWFTTTVAALDGGNAHRSCDTTDGEGAF